MSIVDCRQILFNVDMTTMWNNYNSKASLITKEEATRENFKHHAINVSFRFHFVCFPKRFGGTINSLFSLPYEWVYACITYSFGGWDSAKGRTYLQLCENLWRILLLDKARLYLRSLHLIGINEMYFCQSLMTNSNPISINVKSTSIWLLFRF